MNQIAFEMSTQTLRNISKETHSYLCVLKNVLNFMIRSKRKFLYFLIQLINDHVRPQSFVKQFN